MGKKQVLVYSYDLGGQNNIYGYLCAEHPNIEWRTVFNTHIEEREAVALLKACDIVILTPSSFETTTDHLLLRLTEERGIPCVVMADTQGPVTHRGLLGKVAHVHAVVASPYDTMAAEKMRYRSVRYLGGPPHWATWFYVKPAYERKPGVITVFMSGMKQAAVTDHFLEAIIKGMEKLDWRWRLIFSPHPREVYDGHDLSFRKQLLASVSTVKQGKHHIDTLIASADVVFATGGSTSALAAVHMRKRAIYFDSERMRQHNREQGISPLYAPAQAGALLIARQRTIPKMVARLFTGIGLAELRDNQERLYPKHTGQNPVKQVISFLENL